MLKLGPGAKGDARKKLIDSARALAVRFFISFRFDFLKIRECLGERCCIARCSICEWRVNDSRVISFFISRLN